MSKQSRAIAILLSVGLVVTFLGPTAVGPASASISPQPLSRVTGGAFEDLASAEGVPVEVETSTIRIQVHENGTATFRVRNVINESAASRLDTDADVFEAIRDSVSDRVVEGNAKTSVNSVRLEGDVVRITYSVADFAHRTANGGLVVDRFSDHPEGYVVYADRVELHGPDGWEVANNPATGRVRSLDTHDGGENVVWNGGLISEDTYPVLVPEDGPLAGAGAHLVVAGEIGPTMLGHAVMAGTPSSIVLAIALLVCRGLPDPADDPVEPDSVTQRLKNRLLPISIVFTPIAIVLPITPIGGFGPPFVAIQLVVFTTIVAFVGVVFCRLGDWS
jgi:hypothetical protein